MNLEQSLNKQIEDEFKGVLEYDELIEKMPREDTKHIETLRKIQKEEGVHTLELINMAVDMGYPEPEIIQKLEDFFKVEEH